MQTVVPFKPKRQGKSELTYKVVQWAIAAKKKLLIGTTNEEKLFNLLKARFPHANIKIVKNGVEINGK